MQPAGMQTSRLTPWSLGLVAGGLLLLLAVAFLLGPGLGPMQGFFTIYQHGRTKDAEPQPHPRLHVEVECIARAAGSYRAS